MTPEQQNIAIAESLGWKPHSELDETWCAPHQSDCPLVDELVPRPNYHGSLDACAEFEAMLADSDDSHGSRWRYIQELIEVTGAECMDVHRNVFTVVHATAPQRCEAYLRTLNLWQESK